MSGLAAPGAGEAAAARHLIHRLELELHTSEKTLAEALLPRLSGLHHDRLQPLVERICDDVSPDGRRHRLQTLELDLGSLSLEQLDDQLAERLEQALRRALTERLPAAQPDPPGASATTQPPGPAPGDDAELIATYAATGQLPWWAPRDQPALIADALARCLPASAQPILQALASRPNALDRLRRSVHPHQRALLEAAIAALLQSQALGSAHHDTPDPGAEAGAPAAIPPVEPQVSAASEPSPAHPLQASAARPLALALPAVQRLTPSAVTPRLQGAIDETWPIDGAGLVLLWPFLETLCRRLDLLGADRQFRGEPQRQRAIALFAWLVNETLDLREWHLTLAKVLCGVPPDHPWLLEASLQPAEVLELQGPLAAALAHAGGRLGDDAEVFRQSLLQRPGLLSRQPGGWLLQVERRDGDGVLADLPWSVQGLRLVWMAEGLQVSW